MEGGGGLAPAPPPVEVKFFVRKFNVNLINKQTRLGYFRGGHITFVTWNSKWRLSAILNYYLVMADNWDLSLPGDWKLMFKGCDEIPHQTHRTDEWLAVTHRTLTLTPTSDVSPWPWPWPRPRLRRLRPRGCHALHLRPGLCDMEFVPLGYLFERILAVPASLAPVEMVFFQSVGWSSTHIVRKCHTSSSSHCVCQVFHLQLTVVMVSVRAMALLIRDNCHLLGVNCH